MKFVIDLIEDIRVEIGNEPDYTVHAMLLKEDPDNPENLIYGGETALHHFVLEESARRLIFHVKKSDKVLSIGELVKHILLYDMEKMMYEIRLRVNPLHDNIEVIGFGKSPEEKKYFFFIKL